MSHGGGGAHEMKMGRFICGLYVVLQGSILLVLQGILQYHM